MFLESWADERVRSKNEQGENRNDTSPLQLQAARDRMVNFTHHTGALDAPLGIGVSDGDGDGELIGARKSHTRGRRPRVTDPHGSQLGAELGCLSALRTPRCSGAQSSALLGMGVMGGPASPLRRPLTDKAIQVGSLSLRVTVSIVLRMYVFFQHAQTKCPSVTAPIAKV